MTAIDMTIVQELLDLCDDGDVAFLVELIGVFLRDAPERVAAIRAGCVDGDLGAIGFAAHALRGSAGNLGARTVQRCAEEVQRATRSGDLEAVRSGSRELCDAYEAAAAELSDLATRLAAR